MLVLPRCCTVRSSRDDYERHGGQLMHWGRWALFALPFTEGTGKAGNGHDPERRSSPRYPGSPPGTAIQLATRSIVAAVITAVIVGVGTGMVVQYGLVKGLQPSLVYLERAQHETTQELKDMRRHLNEMQRQLDRHSREMLESVK